MKLRQFVVLSAIAPSAAFAADFSGTCKPEIPGIAGSDLTGRGAVKQ
jgi:hypothetical protein